MIDSTLIDVKFKGKAGEISLAALGYKVEKHGLNSIFKVPSYSNINSVDWLEYDGEDCDFSACTVDPLDISFNVFGDGEEAIDTLIGGLRSLGLDSDIEVSVVVKEDNLTNAIKFTTKFSSAVKNKSFIEYHPFLYEKIFSDDFSADFVTDEGELWRHLAFVTLTFTRHNNAQYFGLLQDNTRGCQGIPTEQFVEEDEYPRSNVSVEFRRYSRNGKTTTLVSTFKLYNNYVYAYTLKGVIQGLTQIAQSKDPFEVITEGMVGKVMQTKKANKRRSKDISLPLLVRANSIAAIFQYLGQYKTYVHNTLTSGDMLYLHCDRAGDYAVYPTGCNVTRSYIDGQWVEMTLSFCCYKEGFDFTADTDDVPDDNPEPPLPPLPPPTFNPYAGIDKTKWEACKFGSATTQRMILYPFLAAPNANEDDLQYPYNSLSNATVASTGWSCYTKAITQYPVGTLFFAVENKNAEGATLYNTLVVLPWCYENLNAIVGGFMFTATLQGWQTKTLTLVATTQVCNVLSKNIKNWKSELKEAPSYGGLIGKGTVMVHSSIKSYLNTYAADGLTLANCDDFDTQVDNIISMLAEGEDSYSNYYTESGLKNAKL